MTAERRRVDFCEHQPPGLPERLSELASSLLVRERDHGIVTGEVAEMNVTGEVAEMNVTDAVRLVPPETICTSSPRATNAGLDIT